MLCPVCGEPNYPGEDHCVFCVFDLASVDLPFSNNQVEGSLIADPVSVLDPRRPVTVLASAPLKDAIAAMLAERVGAVLVVGGTGRLVGILTERDFLTRVAGSPGYTVLPVRQFMTRDPESVTPTDPLAFALAKMDLGGYRHLPVTDSGRPVGVISVRDILRHVMRITDER
jgi:CBS domain-containing protein